MMQKSCPICGAETFPGARFCRRCGAPVRHTADEGGEEVSPQAATVPLSEQDRATDGLGSEEPARAADTSRVSRAELERLLQTQQQTGDVTGADFGRRTRLDAAAQTHAAAPDVPRTTHPEHPGLETVAESPPEVDEEVGGELDEELTVTVPRPSRPLVTRETATELSPLDADTPTHAGASRRVNAGAAPATPPAAPARARRRWPLVVALCGAGLLFAVAAAWLGARFLLRPAPADVSAPAPAPPANDPNQLFDEKLAEAEALLAQGNMDGALAALGEANRLVPTNTRAHQRLGELLVAAGRRREAIEEFRAVTRQTPDDFAAWRQLAAAQFAEGLHAEAAESYRRLVALVGESSADPNDLLSYADALRLSGRQTEARALYERLGSVPFEGVAALARQRLAELAPTPAPSPNGQQGDRPNDTQAGTGETVSSSAPPAPPTPAPTQAASTTQPATQPPRAGAASPAERYRRGVELWSSDRAAAVGEFRAAAGAGNPDAHYYLGLSYVEGRSLQSLKRAEIVAALGHFQYAQRGQFAGPARRHTQQLEREFDRIRKQ